MEVASPRSEPMNRTITFLLLTAILMAGLGWFFDRNGDKESDETGQETAVTPSAAGSPLFSPKEPTGPISLANDGMVDLYLQVSTMDDGEASPASNMELEAFFESDGMLSHSPFTKHASSLGTFQTDDKGTAHFRVQLPTSRGSKLPENGALFVCATQVGWQKPSKAWFHCKPQMDSTIRQPLVLNRGATMQVRPLGFDPKQSVDEFIGPILSVQALDFEQKEQFIPFFPSEPLGQGMPMASFSVSKKGRYRLFARCPEGVGLVSSVFIDPAAPPTEVTLLFEDFGSLAGKVKLPPNFLNSRPLVIRAVAENKASAESLLWDAGFTSEDYPATTATGLVQEDGSFRVAGLAPGSYRLGFPHFGPPPVGSGWFSEASFQTGNSNVELEMPATFLELAFVRGKESKSKLAPGRVALAEFYSSSSAYAGKAFAPKQVMGPNGEMGYYLLPGTDYRFLAYGKDLPVFEVQLPSTFPSSPWTLEIPNPEPAFGFLEWTGPSENVMYEILTPKFGLVLETWDSRPGYIPGEMKRQLPPGRYQIRGFGINGGEYAGASHWVDIVAGETTPIGFELPPAGWLNVTLSSGEEGEKGAPIPVSDPGTASNAPRITYRSAGHPRLIMRPRDGSTPIGLTFFSELPGMGMWHTGMIEVGENQRADECFAPGVYDLDVSVPGFQAQRLEVKIQKESLTSIVIALQDSE